RTDRTRAALLLWGGWLLVTGLTFSFMQGIFHPYYLVALAPAIAALVGIGTVAAWRLRHARAGIVLLAIGLAATAWMSYALLGGNPSWFWWLPPLVVTTGSVLTAMFVALRRLPRRLVTVLGGAALIVVLTGPAAYAVQTAGTGHEGALPTAGPGIGNAFGPG